MTLQSLSGKKWAPPIALGILLTSALSLTLRDNRHSLLHDPKILIQTLSGALFFLSGVGLYRLLFPRSGLLPLLGFHFLTGLLWILAAPAHALWFKPGFRFALLALTPAVLLNFSQLISENVVAWKKSLPSIASPYLFSLVLWGAYAFSSQRDLGWETKLRLASFYFLLAAYAYWLLRLFWIVRNPRLSLDRIWARYLLKAQLLGFVLPIAVFGLTFALLGPFPSLVFAPISLLGTAAIWLGVLPGRRRQAEVYIVQSEKRKSFGNLLAGLAHEINNPLNFIGSNIEPLQEGLEKIRARLPASDTESRVILEELAAMASSMDNGVQTIRKLLEQFREFPKPRVEQKESLSLAEILDRSVELTSHKWKNRVTVLRRYAEAPKIRGFATELQQVFTNLVANACDACSAGGTVEIATQATVGGVNVLIRDSGKGIAKEDIGKIFDPFFTTKGQGEGSGLGLSIAQQIIKSHRGSIEVQSEEGCGTEFLVFLPA